MQSKHSKVAIATASSENCCVEDSGEEHIEISRLGGWIDSVTDELMGFIHTPVVRSCGLEKLQMIMNEEPPELCTMI